MDDRLRGGRSQKTFSEDEPELQGRMLRDLSAELLASVFSYLPQRELVEIMIVSKQWETIVEGDCSLWKKVEVARSWKLEVTGGEGGSAGANQMAARLLANAKEVRFLCDIKDRIPGAVMGMLGQQLDLLDLPRFSFHPPFFSALLAQLPTLKCLLVRGEPRGTDPIFFCHSTLERLELRCDTSRPLIVDCPNLTHLSTAGTITRDLIDISPGELTVVPRFFCPLLTTLSLSALHCASGVLESMAAHAPNVKWRQVCCNTGIPFSVLERFKHLRVLKLRGYEEWDDFRVWPYLEELVLTGHCFLR